jgi:hypothetical protein
LVTGSDRRTMAVMRKTTIAVVEKYDAWREPDEPYDRHRPEDPLRDSEIDFDDEADEDQLPLDLVEAIEVGANLDDPDQLAED